MNIIKMMYLLVSLQNLLINILWNVLVWMICQTILINILWNVLVWMICQTILICLVRTLLDYSRKLGTSFNSYLNKVRTRNVEHDLKYSDISTDIAMKNGFLIQRH